MKNAALIICLFLVQFYWSQKPFDKAYSITFNQGFSLLNFISRDFVGHNKLSVNRIFGEAFMVGIDGNYSYAEYNKYKSTDQATNYFWLEAPQIRDASVGISLYFFFENYKGMAPVGRYAFVSGSYGIANKYYFTKTATGPVNNPNYIYHNYMNKSVTMKSCILNIGFGRNFIVCKRILLGYRVDFGYDLLNNTVNEYKIRYLMRPSVNIGYTF